MSYETAKSKFQSVVDEMKRLSNLASDAYYEAVKEVARKHNVHLATGHLSDTWQWRKPRGKIWHAPYDHGQEENPVFQDLSELEEIGEDFGIGPSNSERIVP